MAQASGGLRLRGQSEPLTRRLKRLLDEYSDGLAVPKELLQNADDAGATEVTLVYDCRENANWLGAESLLDPAMADCQGRALWAHNNATFSDEDFDNILQLSGATKLEKTAKVGRFGLGFNSVYNLTDVPQILSRHRMLVLDPHGERRGEGFLEAVYASQGERDTGVELDFRAQPNLLDRYANQFAPFASVAGCDLRASNGEFNGTLLRLPLRTEALARKSKICERVYSDSEMHALLRLAAEQADTMLLFTQTVRKFRCLFLPSEARNANNKTQLIFSACKRPLCYFKKHLIAVPKLSIPEITVADQEFAAQSSTLKVAEKLIELTTNSANPLVRESKCQMTVEVDVQLNPVTKETFKLCTKDSSRVWLVCSAVGTGASLAMAMEQRRHGLAPVGSVAVLIQQSDKVVPLSRDSQPASLLFCFLPLPVENPFPVILNASFSVTSNRRHLNEVTVDEKQGVWSLGQWNRVLLTELICPAYIDALEILAGMRLVNPEVSQDLWPRLESATQAVWRPLIEKFFGVLLDGQTPIFHTSSGWKSLSQTVFLDPSIHALGEVSASLCRLATKLVAANEGVASLTDEVRRTAEQLKHKSKILQRQWSGETLLLNFVSKVQSLWQSAHNADCLKVLKFILDAGSRIGSNIWGPASTLVTPNVLNRMRQCYCIPNTSNALHQPSQLLEPGCHAARLFGTEEPVFPHSELRTADRLKALQSIGLRVDLTWPEVLARAESIKGLPQPQRSERTTILLSYLDYYRTNFNRPFDQLKSISFLPAMRKPQYCCFSWLSDRYHASQLFQPTELFDPDCGNLVSGSQIVMDSVVLSKVSASSRQKLLAKIGVKGYNQISYEISWQQLVAVARSKVTDQWTLRVCRDVYQHLSAQLNSRSLRQAQVSALVTQVPEIVWSSEEFLKPRQVSEFRRDSEFPPFLYVLAAELCTDSSCMPFLRAAGVASRFDITHFLGVLLQLSQRYSSAPLTTADLRLSMNLINKVVEYHHGDSSLEDLVAPDQNCVLRPKNQLCFNNLPWLTTVQLPNGTYFCHKDISYGLCEKLGIPSQRESMLAEWMHPLPFGQHEDLTTRLQNIISGYPLGIELFKELIQNADDAGASEIRFILDRRSHGKEKLLSDEWKDLQGPALLVYNNSVFSDADIKGIQHLGLGSKRDDAWKAGQYGIGFNCVYNITDVPSFLSDGKVFCVMDPHCRYMPGANFSTPGGMFKGLERLKQIFADVFAGYYPEGPSHVGGTVFRLPLRSKTAAAHSLICENAVSADEIKSLFQQFKNELGRTMLFLANVRQVQLSEVSEGGQLTKLLTINSETVDMSGDFASFREECRSASQTLLSSGAQLVDLPLSSVIYELTTTCSGTFATSKQSKWLVRQQLGGPSKVDVQLRQQVASGKWRLLPKAGVAADLTALKDCKFVGHVYCLLPLPVFTDLPVHLNGHFILDPSRRSLWKADGDADYKEQWNQLLATQLLPECYGRLLVAARKFFNQVDKLGEFYRLFPEYVTNGPTLWDELVCVFFQKVFNDRLEIFPVRHDSQKQLRWLPLAQSSSDVDGGAGFLLPHNLSDFLQQVLRNLSFPLIFPDQVCLRQSLQSCRLDFVPVADAVSIAAFLSGSASKALCDSLPNDVSRTSFASSEAVVGILAYLAGELQDLQELKLLHGTPLNLSSGSRLTVFGFGQNPLFLTEFYDLFLHKEAKHEFAHQENVLALSDEERSDLIDANLFRRFFIKDFFNILRREHPSVCNTNNLMVPKSDFGMTEEAIEKWLARAWEFLNCECSDSDNSMAVLLDPVFGGSAHLVPISESSFASISQAPCIFKPVKVNLDDCSRKLQETLQQIKAPSLWGSNLQLIDKICANVKKPESMLRVIQFALSENTNVVPLNESQAVNVLLYIQNYWQQLSQSQGKASLLSIVRTWPVFVISDGRCCALNSDQACILPAELVSDEMDKWKSFSRAIFLKDNVSLHTLYKKLKCDKMAELQVYVKFILPVFSQFSDETKKKHLKRLCDLIWSFDRTKLENAELYKELEWSLQRVELIPVERSWKTVRSFFDENVQIFKDFLGPESFLPAPYNNERWRKLMKISGLIIECDGETVISFANQVAAQGATGGTDEVLRKSELLLEFIDSVDFKSHRSDAVVFQLAQIPFIIANSDDVLRSLCASFDAQMSSLSQCCSFDSRYICWTVKFYAPSWVNSGSCFVKYMQTVANAEFLRHLAKLFSTPTFTTSDLQSDCLTRRLDIMRSVYAKLSEIHRSGHVNQISAFNQVACIIIPSQKGHYFVTPKRVTFDKKSKILPYIVSCPKEFVHFRNLFTALGATHAATLEQLRLALELIRDQQQPEFLSEKQLFSVSHIISNIIVLLERGEKLQFQSGKVLFLPTLCKRHGNANEALQDFFELVDCRQLTISDSEEYGKRLVDTQELRLLDLSFCKLGTDKERRLYFSLNTDMGLKLLSKNVSEKLISDINKLCEHGEDCQLRLCVEDELNHPVLHKCIVSILLLEQDGPDTHGDEKLKAVKSLISCFSIVCLSELKTRLVVSGAEQPDSEGEKSFLVAGEKLLMNHQSAQDENEENQKQLWRIDFSEAIQQILSNGFNLTADQKRYLTLVLMMDNPDGMLELLSRSKISLHESRLQQFAEPSFSNDSLLGEGVPDIDHCLLRQLPDKPKDLLNRTVAFRTPEGGFVYAKVVERHPGDSDNPWTAEVTIEIGGYRRRVTTSDLYSIEEISVSEILESPPSGQDLRKTVDQLLCSAAALPTEQQRQAFKRVLAQYSKSEDSFNEVRGYAANHEWTHQFNNFVDEWHDEVVHVTRYRQILIAEEIVFTVRTRHYRRGGGRRVGGGGSVGFGGGVWNSSTTSLSRGGRSSNQCVTRALPNDAARYLKTSQHDLRTASRLAESGEYNWACYISWQAAEKALKALLISQGQPIERSHQLSQHLCCVSGSDLQISLTDHVASLARAIVDDCRYPSERSRPRIPSEVFGAEQAHQALLGAEGVERCVSSVIGEASV